MLGALGGGERKANSGHETREGDLEAKMRLWQEGLGNGWGPSFTWRGAVTAEGRLDRPGPALTANIRLPSLCCDAALLTWRS